MQEWRVRYISDRHIAMVGGTFVSERAGSVQDFPIVIRGSEVQILDLLSETMNAVATFTLGLSVVNLVLNEETGQCYSVTYDRRNQTHIFPTKPEVTISLADY